MQLTAPTDQTAPPAEQQDAGQELLEASVLLSLLLLRYSGHLRRLAGEHLDDLAGHVWTVVAGADLTRIPAHYRRDAAGRVADDLDSLIAQVYSRLYADIQRELAALGETIAEHTVTGINDAVVPGAAVTPDRSRLRGAVGAALLAGASLSDCLSQEGGNLDFRFRRIVTDATRNGASLTDTKAGVQGAMASARRSIDTIINSAVTATHATTVGEVVQANDGITTRGWIHCSVLDGRTSDLCRSRANLKWLADGTPVGHSREFRRPPLHPNCRSSLVPWLLGADDLPVALRRRVEASGRADRLSGKPPQEPSLDAFLQSRTQAEQKSILGSAQWKLWKDGKITQAGLLDQSSRPLTLEQLRRLLGLD
jgi:hypothetical protein